MSMEIGTLIVMKQTGDRISYAKSDIISSANLQKAVLSATNQFESDIIQSLETQKGGDWNGII